MAVDDQSINPNVRINAPLNNPNTFIHVYDRQNPGKLVSLPNMKFFNPAIHSKEPLAQGTAPILPSTGRITQPKVIPNYNLAPQTPVQDGKVAQLAPQHAQPSTQAKEVEPSPVGQGPGISSEEEELPAAPTSEVKSVENGESEMDESEAFERKRLSELKAVGYKNLKGQERDEYQVLNSKYPNA